MKPKIKKLLIIFCIIIALIGGFLLGVKYKSSNQPESNELHEGAYSLINPLISCVTSKSESPANSKIEEKLRNIINDNTDKGNINFASVYFRDLANGPWFGINENDKFTPASLLKLPIMITYYKLAEVDPSILSEKIKIEEFDNLNIIQNITSKNVVEIGKVYTNQELINYMITASDNVAANALLQQIPPEKLDKTFSDLGIEIPTVENPENYMSVKNYATFFRVLYNASYLNKEYSEKALELLSEVEYKKALVAGVPFNTIVAHKFGERKVENLEQLHDCGIIYKNSKPYLLCVMTRGRDFENLSNVIREISASVYFNVN